MGQIKVTPEQLEEVAKEVNKAHNDSKAKIEGLTKKLNDLQSRWDGMKRERFYSTFNDSKKKDFDLYLATLLEVEKELKKAANKFRQQDAFFTASGKIENGNVQTDAGVFDSTYIRKDGKDPVSFRMFQGSVQLNSNPQPGDFTGGKIEANAFNLGLGNEKTMSTSGNMKLFGTQLEAGVKNGQLNVGAMVYAGKFETKVYPLRWFGVKDSNFYLEGGVLLGGWGGGMEASKSNFRVSGGAGWGPIFGFGVEKEMVPKSK